MLIVTISQNELSVYQGHATGYKDVQLPIQTIYFFSPNKICAPLQASFNLKSCLFYINSKKYAIVKFNYIINIQLILFIRESNLVVFLYVFFVVFKIKPRI